MIGSRQMLDVLSEARRGGAKVILVGDSEQLQAIEAGAAFRAIQERVGGAELTEIRRQHVAWQRDATRELAMGETNKAIGRYNNAGCINAEANPEAAQKLLVEHWHESGEKFPKDSRIMMAHTRADVAALNQAARIKMREDNKLSDDFEIITSRGQRAFAEGERLIFLRNDKALGVKNGTLGTLMEVEGSALAVRTDDGRKVIVQTGTYRDIDHGYAVTVHKAQGVTVDRSFVMATDGFDRHLAYVAFSRHREKLDVVYDRESFRSDDHMMRTLSRERSKDVTADYLGPSAAARDLTPSPGVAGNSLQQTKKGRKDDRSAGWEI
jgi:Ti-type conjugative transfer relaxase TraA